MKTVQRSATVAAPQSHMYALLLDVESYPEFVPGCTRARIESRSEQEQVATLAVRRGPLRAEFTTRNELEPERRIRMRLVRGPFRFLEGEWTLSPTDAGGCRIELTIRFELANRLTAVVFEPLFQETVAALVDAFVQRATRK